MKKPVSFDFSKKGLPSREISHQGWISSGMLHRAVIEGSGRKPNLACCMSDYRKQG